MTSNVISKKCNRCGSINWWDKTIIYYDYGVIDKNQLRHHCTFCCEDLD